MIGWKGTRPQKNLRAGSLLLGEQKFKVMGTPGNGRAVIHRRSQRR